MNNQNEDLKLIWLSHILAKNTPAYGGGDGFSIKHEKEINCGDSCNTVKLSFSNHLGSHVDAPRHFVDDGVTTESYEPNDWVFNKPIIIELEISDSEIITQEHIENICSEVDDADLVLIKTGFEKHRNERKYWETPPGYAPELASFLSSKFESFSAIGMDTISISSYQHRELGRAAHDAFLQNGFRIFEDLTLKALQNQTKLSKVIALPLRFDNSDGAPCSIIGWVHKNELD